MDILYPCDIYVSQSENMGIGLYGGGKWMLQIWRRCSNSRLKNKNITLGFEISFSHKGHMMIKRPREIEIGAVKGKDTSGFCQYQRRWIGQQPRMWAEKTNSPKTCGVISRKAHSPLHTLFSSGKHISDFWPAEMEANKDTVSSCQVSCGNGLPWLWKSATLIICILFPAWKVTDCFHIFSAQFSLSYLRM